MNESFRVGAALLLKTLYTNVALDKYHRVSKRQNKTKTVHQLTTRLYKTGRQHEPHNPPREYTHLYHTP